MPYLIRFLCDFIISIIIYFSFIYFAILSFRCFTLLLILISSSELFWVIILASFLVFCHFTAYFGRFFLYLISFLFCPFIKTPLFKVSLWTYFTVRFMLFLLTLNNSMSIYCFSHYFNDIYMTTIFKQ